MIDQELARRARDVTFTLVGWPSVTGSESEASFARSLHALLAGHPYFQAHPDHLVLQPIPDDPFGRANVLALVRGSGRRTVALSGHFDVVPVDDYGELAPLAWHPEELRDRLIERLAASGRDPLALADLKSGEFLPGRGILDMKSGVAAGIAALEAFAAEPGRQGNLLLLATPDEEDRSVGMRALAQSLPAFAAAHGLDIALGVNLDAINDRGDGRLGQVVAQGVIGKLLLSALVVGVDSHACYPLDGVNGAYLAAELVAELEMAPELAEEAGAELAAPPTVLGARDLKAGYNVTTPSRVWLFWNVLTHRRSAAEVMQVATALAHRAAARARERMAERSRRLHNPPALAPAWSRIAVLPYSAVHAAADAADPSFAARFAAAAAALAAGTLDYPTRSRQLAELAWAASGLEGPAIVLCFGSMPYPAMSLGEGEANRGLREVLARVAAEAARACNTPITPIRYFPAIADMSFLGPVDAGDLQVVAGETPIWGSSIRWDLSGSPSPGFPVINVGPWGRDYHHWLERVHVRYAFEVLPLLVRDLCRAVLAG
ncbi:MAG: M20/M25/M40 family metallo-hydrolase [Dongiaceae bacterium]